MKPLFRAVLVVVVLTFAQMSYAVAATGNVAEMWSGLTKITRLYPYWGGMIFFVEYRDVFAPFRDYRNSAGAVVWCGRWDIPTSALNYKVLAAGLMLAYANGDPINFHLDTQPVSCNPRVDRFEVYPKPAPSP